MSPIGESGASLTEQINAPQNIDSRRSVFTCGLLVIINHVPNIWSGKWGRGVVLLGTSEEASTGGNAC